MSKMLKSSGAMAAATLLSRVLGMVREIVSARFMGDGAVAGAFQVAFQIPNLFRRLLGEGALTAAFIPVFKEKEKTAGEAEMWRAANAVLSGLLVVAGALVVLVMGGVTLALWLGRWHPDTRLMLELLRFMFPYLLLACVAAVFVGMLNARGRFFIPALGPLLLNLAMIAAVLFLAPRWGETLPEQIFALALGALAGGAVQAAFQYPPLARQGFRFRWVSPWRNDDVRRIVRQMLPAVVGLAAFQINVVTTQLLAFAYGTDGEPIVASFNYAVRLMELPQGVFGISLATFLLPTLSGLALEKKYAEFRGTLREGLGYLCFVNFLCAALLFGLAEPMVRLLFERGQFGPDATDRAAFALMFLAPGLVAFSVVNVLARAFYAVGDTQTPMRISVVCLGLNLLLAFAFIWPLRQGGLALANTITSVLNVGLLLFALRKKLKRLDFHGLPLTVLNCVGAAVVAGAVAWFGARQWEAQFGHAHLGTRLGEVFVPMALASLVYLGLTLALKVEAARRMARMMRGGKN
jgi:putative peptidoglycan lipid II flippase